MLNIIKLFKKMKRKIILNFLIFISFFNFSFEYLVIPFHYLNDKSKMNYNLEEITGKEFLELTTNKLVTTISIGSPFKQLELYIQMDYKLFFIGKGYCEKNAISFYEPEQSTSFKKNSSSFYSYPFDDLRNMTIGNDSCTLYNSYKLDKNTTLKGLHLLYGSKINILNDIIYKDKICGILGLKLHDMQDSYYMKFQSYYLTNSLKQNNISNYTDWVIEFFNDEQKKKNKGYDGYLILGAGDNTYLQNIKKLDENKIEYTYCSSLSNAQEWTFDNNEIYYIYPKDNNKTIMDNKYKKSEINFDLDYYFATKEYFDSIKNSFFKTYLESGQCKVIKLKEFYLRYQFISCVQSFKSEISKFPTLSFFNYAYKYTFNITYEDCFKEINNNILFLFFYDPWSPDIFKFGKNFLKKFQFLFRYEARRIGFLNNNIDNEDSEKDDDKNKGNNGGDSQVLKKEEIISIVVIFVLLTGIIIGVFVGKKIWDKNKKKRANELNDDEYEYNSNNNDKMDNKLIN